MSQICLHCQENETNGNHKICDPCYDNAGDYLEQNVERINAVPYLLDEGENVLSDLCAVMPCNLVKHFGASKANSSMPSSERKPTG
jgi:hypothetical protein